MKNLVTIFIMYFLFGCSISPSKNLSINPNINEEGTIIGISSYMIDEELHYLGQEKKFETQQNFNNNKMYSIQLKNNRVLIIKQENNSKLTLGDKVNIVLNGDKAEIRILD